MRSGYENMIPHTPVDFRNSPLPGHDDPCDAYAPSKICRSISGSVTLGMGSYVRNMSLEHLPLSIAQVALLPSFLSAPATFSQKHNITTTYKYLIPLYPHL